MKYALIGISVIFFLYVFFSIIFMVVKTRKWNTAESNYTALIETQQKMLDTQPTLDIGQRISATKELFSIIDILIEYEIINYRRFEIFLEQKNKNLDFESVLQEVSTTVFESLSPDIYVDKNNIITKKCIMQYIQKRVFVEYFLYLQNIHQEGIN